MPYPDKIKIFYDTFREIIKLVHSSIELNEILEIVVWKAAEALDAKGSLLRILNLENGEFELNSAYGLSQEYLAKGPVTQKHLITDLYEEKRAVVIKDVQNDPRIHYPKEAKKEGIQTIIDLPLKFRNGIMGILRIFFSTVREFSDEEIEFAVSLSEQCACAIEKARLIKSQRNDFDQLVLQTEKLSALGRMAAGIAHEINNPLAGILLFSSNLFKKAQKDSSFQEGLGIIIRETQRCKVIIQDLLEFSREKEPNKVVTHINRIIEKSIRILDNEFRLRHIEITKKLFSQIDDSLMDENQIEQVFVNLLLNAAQAINERGTIGIESLMDRARKEIIVHVSDSGPGIPPEEMGKIFDPFFSTKPNGSGLGLAVSYGIIRNHKGHIEVQNLKTGGCRFTITLPKITEDLTREAEPS